jgi:hypothetical protein
MSAVTVAHSTRSVLRFLWLLVLGPFHAVPMIAMVAAYFARKYSSQIAIGKRDRPHIYSDSNAHYLLLRQCTTLLDSILRREGERRRRGKTSVAGADDLLAYDATGCAGVETSIMLAAMLARLPASSLSREATRLLETMNERYQNPVAAQELAAILGAKTALAHPSGKVRSAAIQIVHIGELNAFNLDTAVCPESVVPQSRLERVLAEDEDPLVRRASISKLATHALRYTCASLDPFVTSLDDPDLSVRQAASFACAQLIRSGKAALIDEVRVRALEHAFKAVSDNAYAPLLPLIANASAGNLARVAAASERLHRHLTDSPIALIEERWQEVIRTAWALQNPQTARTENVH